MALLERPKWLNLDLHISTIIEFFQIISDYWGDNMTAILRRELYSLYENKKEPRISDLISILKEVKKVFSRERSYRDTLACDSLINRLEPLTLGELALVFGPPIPI